LEGQALKYFYMIHRVGRSHSLSILEDPTPYRKSHRIPLYQNITLPTEHHTPYQYHKIPYQKIPLPISITRLHSLRSISENSTLYQYQKFTLPTEDPTPHQHQKIPYQKIPHPINIRRPHFLRSISQDPVPYQYQKIPLPTEDPTPSAREASWRRVFDPYAPLLFNLYYYLEQTLHFG